MVAHMNCHLYCTDRSACVQPVCACTPQSPAGFLNFSSVFKLRLKHCCVYCLAVSVWLISALAAAFLRAVRRWRADVLRRRKRKHIHLVLLAHLTIQFRMRCNSVCGLCLKLQPMSCCRLCVVVWMFLVRPVDGGFFK